MPQFRFFMILSFFVPVMAAADPQLFTLINTNDSTFVFDAPSTVSSNAPFASEPIIIARNIDTNGSATVMSRPRTLDNPSNFMPELQAGEGRMLPRFKVVGPEKGLKLHNFATRGPSVRDWSQKFPYSLKNGKAYYAGGNHGVPHKYDDVWSYDVVTNTWTMESAPTPGVRPLHTYWCLDYDDASDRLIQYARISDATGKWPLLQDPDPDIYLIQWPNSTKTWEAFPLQDMAALKNGFGCATVLLPDVNRLITYAGNWDGSGMQSVNLTTGKVETLLSNQEIYHENFDGTPRDRLGMEYVGNGKIIAWEHHNKFTYDLVTNKWTKEENFWPLDLQSAGTAAAYDPVNGLLFFHSQGKFWSYDPVKNKVEMLNIPGMPSAKKESLLYYDIKNNVLVLYEDDATSMFVYRHGDGTVKRQPIPTPVPQRIAP
ncbi:hypothetical protein SAMN05421690_102512 [Nitrosomonas sp. Nm51]|nr:hypothetical protein SAMN05421690_102512 [Nitrosomonas sp. Nm51]